MPTDTTDRIKIQQSTIVGGDNFPSIAPTTADIGAIAFSPLRNTADLSVLRDHILNVASEAAITEFLNINHAYPPAGQIVWKQEKFSFPLIKILELAAIALIDGEQRRRERRAKLTRIEATVARILHRGDNGFTVLKINAGGFKTAVGGISSELIIEAGARVAIWGKLGKRNGEPQLKFYDGDIELLPPEFHDAPALALRRENPIISAQHVEKLEARFGENFFAKIASDETLLNDPVFSRWSPKAKAAILAACVKYQKIDAFWLALLQIGASAKTIANIRAKIETHPDRLNEPYLLVFDGLLSFKQADELRTTSFFADRLSARVSTPDIRLSAIIAQAMNARRRDGHCGARLEALAGYLRKQHGSSDKDIAGALSKCLPFYERRADCLFHKDLWDLETRIARLIKARRATKPSRPPNLAAIKKAARDIGFDPNAEQIVAGRAALSLPLSIITGGPGTGKTTTTALLRELVGAENIAGCAFAARAARNLEENAGIASMTIHRLTRFTKGRAGLRAAAKQWRGLEVLVIDECSMIPSWLFERVLDFALLADVRHVVLIGDAEQLPPIGEGQPFADLIAASSPCDEAIASR
jgi:exodeoxyribonuclease V alpha subunit